MSQRGGKDRNEQKPTFATIKTVAGDLIDDTDSRAKRGNNKSLNGERGRRGPLGGKSKTIRL